MVGIHEFFQLNGVGSEQNGHFPGWGAPTRLRSQHPVGFAEVSRAVHCCHARRVEQDNGRQGERGVALVGDGEGVGAGRHHVSRVSSREVFEGFKLANRAAHGDGGFAVPPCIGEHHGDIRSRVLRVFG